MTADTADTTGTTAPALAAVKDTTSPASVLGSLKARREELRKEKVLDLPVDGWHDPEIIVRYEPLDHAVIRQSGDRADKAPKDRKYEAELNGNADLLIKGCKAVVARINGREYSLRPNDPDGDPTTFDRDLAANLGLDEHATARETVRALFIIEGDIISHGKALVEFSGYRDTEAAERLEGE